MEQLKSAFGLKDIISDVSSRIRTSDRQQIVTRFLQDDICIADHASISYILETLLGSSIAITKSGITSVVVDCSDHDAQHYDVSVSIQSNDVAASTKEEESIGSEQIAR